MSKVTSGSRSANKRSGRPIARCRRSLGIRRPRSDGVVLIGGDRTYRIGPATAAVRPLERDGVRLVAIANSTPADWVIDPLDLSPPVGATALASVGDQLLIGTRDLGTARYHDGEPHPRDWLRRQQLFQMRRRSPSRARASKTAGSRPVRAKHGTGSAITSSRAVPIRSCSRSCAIRPGRSTRCIEALMTRRFTCRGSAAGRGPRCRRSR